MFNSIKSEYFPRLDSEEVQNGTSKERVLASMSRQSIEIISVYQMVNERRGMSKHPLCLNHRFYHMNRVVYST